MGTPVVNTVFIVARSSAIGWVQLETRTTTSTRFSQYSVVLAREPASFWRENLVAVVSLLRDLAKMLLKKSYISCYHYCFWEQRLNSIV